MEAYYTTEHVMQHGRKVEVFRFPTVEAVLAYGNALKSKRVDCLDKSNRKYRDKRVEDTDSRVDSPEWCEGLTDSAAYAAITEPTPAKVSAMDSASAVASFDAPMAPQPRRRLVKRLDDGDAIDAERYAVEHTVERVWQRRFRTAKPVPTLRVAINGSASCGVRSDSMALAAASVLSVVRQAEDNGYAVEVDWVIGSNSPDGSQFITVVPLKRVDECIDWSRLVGFTVGGSTFRTLGFDLVTGLARSDQGYGLGRCLHVEAETFGHDIASPSSFRDEAQAKWWVGEALKALASKGSAAAA